MREYKFRIWMCDPLNIADGKMYTGKEAYRENFIEFTENGLLPTDECSHIMQYTGLTDKYGTEIYEGDLIRIDGGNSENKPVGNVIFEDGCFCFDAYWIKDGQSNPELKYYIDMTFITAEVIGNIFESPELKGKL